MRRRHFDKMNRFDIAETPPSGAAGTPPPFVVRDEGRGHKYFTQTCNLVDDIPLTLYERALYKCLKRICGEHPDGYCSRNTDSLAAMTGMSAGAVSKAKQGLLRTDRPELRGKALIRVEEVDGRPGRAQHVITVVDVWPENMAYYADLYERKRTGGTAGPAPAGAGQGSLFLPDQSSQQSSPGEVQSSQQSSPGELKKTLKKSLRRRPKEEQQQPPYPPKGSRRASQAAAAGTPSDVTAAAVGASPNGSASGTSPAVFPVPVVFPVVPGEDVQALMDAGCCRADAEALVAEAPWERIAEQIAWLPWRNCESPRYWLPRYIRDGWPKPRGLRDQEEARAAEARRRAAGLSREEDARRQRAERDARAAGRRAFLGGLSPPEAEALDTEAHERLLLDGVPGGGSTGRFWRDWVAGKGREGRAYHQARDSVRDAIVDARISGVDARISGQASDDGGHEGDFGEGDRQ